MASSNDYSALKRQKTITYTLLQVVGIFAILLVGNCFDWLNMKFDPSQLTTWKYWNGVIQQVLMYSIALIIGYMGRLEKEVLNNKEYEQSMNLYHAYFVQITDTFTSYCDKILNPKIRKQYYKASIQKKLYKLEQKNKKKDEWKLEYERAIEWLIKNPEKPFCDYPVTNYIEEEEKKACRQYILRRYTLESLILDEKIESSCKTFEDYPRVNPHSFTWGVRSHETSANNYKVENTTSKDLAAKFVQKALGVVLMAIVIGSVTADASSNELLEQANGWMKLMIKYAMRVGSIVWSYANGIFFGKGMFESNYLDVINNRNRIVAEYIDWKVAQKETETASYKLKVAIAEKDKAEERKVAETVSNQVTLTEEEKRELEEREIARRETNNLLEKALHTN